jgi:hypothetical protein
MSILSSPHLEILPPPQRRLWDALDQIPSYFTLYGGTALALRLAHRQSEDFDFFCSRDLDAVTFSGTIGFLKEAQVIQRDKNSFSAIVDREGPVKVSFFGVPALRRLEPPDIVESNGLRIATLIDLAGTNASVVQVRAEAKDYLDIDALIAAGVGLAQALAAAKAIYGRSFNPQITLKALSYTEDGNLARLPDGVKNRLATAARHVDLDRLPELTLSPDHPGHGR